MRGEMPAGSYGAACASRLYGRGYGRSFGRGEFVRFYETTQVQHREYRWTIVNSFIDLIPAISQDPARTAVVEALPGDNIASIAASAAAAAVEADWACSGGGGQHAAAPNAPPYQGHRFDTKGPVYKDPAVVELLRTKYADKMEEAVSRDRAKSVDNLKRTAWTGEGVFRTLFIWQRRAGSKGSRIRIPTPPAQISTEVLRALPETHRVPNVEKQWASSSEDRPVPVSMKNNPLRHLPSQSTPEGGHVGDAPPTGSTTTLSSLYSFWTRGFWSNGWAPPNIDVALTNDPTSAQL